MIYLAWIGLVLMILPLINNFLDMFKAEKITTRIASFIVAISYAFMVYFFIRYIFF